MDGEPCMDMDMEMVMTFGKWTDYKLKLLWDDWDITSRVEFGFSWLLVFVMGVVYHLIKFYMVRTEDDMRKVSASGHQTLLEHENGAVNNSRSSKAEEGISGNGAASALMDSSSPSNAMVILRVKHAALAAIHYALALLLMLVAMTYNPCLFLACCLGYGAGDYAFTNNLLFSSSRSGISNYACH